MKFSWITVFGLTALSAALGVQAWSFCAEARIRENQLQSAGDQVARLLDQCSRRDAETLDLKESLAEKSAGILEMKAGLAEEKQTNDPLREQIEDMHTERNGLMQNVKRLQTEVDKLKTLLADERTKREQADLGQVEAKRLRDEIASLKVNAEKDRKAWEAAGKAKIGALELDLKKARSDADDLRQEVSRLESSLKKIEKTLSSSPVAPSVDTKMQKPGSSSTPEVQPVE